MQRLAVLDAHAREPQPLPIANLRRAVDRDRHDRRAAVQHQPPDPGLRLLRQISGPRSAALGIHRHHPTVFEDRLRRDERLVVARPAPHREHAALQVHPLRPSGEQLRFRHEPHLAADEDADQEVVHVGEVVGREDRRAGLGNVLRGDHARAQQSQRVERAEHAHEVVDEARPTHARARVRGPSFVYDLVRVFSALYALTLLRARVIAAQNVPETGAAILAPNHFSYMDHFLIGIFIRRKVRFMAKSQLFNKWAQWVYLQGGVFPVRRGARDNEAFVTAEAILEHGGVVAMYPEGGRSRTGELASQAKPGIGRLVLDSGAPVVPIAIHGSAKIRNWKRLRFPRVRVQYGEPLHFEREPEATRERQQEVADAIFAEVRALYARLGARLGG